MKRFTKQACRENVVASFFPLKRLLSFKEDGRSFHIAAKERLFSNIFPYFRFTKVSLSRVSCVVTINSTSILKHVIKNVRKEAFVP